MAHARAHVAHVASHERIALLLGARQGARFRGAGHGVGKGVGGDKRALVAKGRRVHPLEQGGPRAQAHRRRGRVVVDQVDVRVRRLGAVEVQEVGGVGIRGRLGHIVRHRPRRETVAIARGQVDHRVGGQLRIPLNHGHLKAHGGAHVCRRGQAGGHHRRGQGLHAELIVGRVERDARGQLGHLAHEVGQGDERPLHFNAAIILLLGAAHAQRVQEVERRILLHVGGVRQELQLVEGLVVDVASALARAQFLKPTGRGHAAHNSRPAIRIQAVAGNRQVARSRPRVPAHAVAVGRRPVGGDFIRVGPRAARVALRGIRTRKRLLGNREGANAAIGTDLRRTRRAIGPQKVGARVRARVKGGGRRRRRRRRVARRRRRNRGVGRAAIRQVAVDGHARSAIRLVGAATTERHLLAVAIGHQVVPVWILAVAILRVLARIVRHELQRGADIVPVRTGAPLRRVRARIPPIDLD